MQQYFLDSNIKVICIPADDFPNGVLTAHQKLHALLGDEKERKYFGISYPDKPGSIIYKAATKEKLLVKQQVLIVKALSSKKECTTAFL